MLLKSEILAAHSCNQTNSKSTLHYFEQKIKEVTLVVLNVIFYITTIYVRWAPKVHEQ